MAKQVCAFCGQKGEWTKCPGCGSEPTEAPKKPKTEEMCWRTPVFYNGYIVWALTEGFWDYDQITYYFYLGERLVETIKITRDLMREFVPEDKDVMPFLWKLLEIAQGKEEVMRVETMNRRGLAAFEIRRVPTEREKELGRLHSLPEDELMQEIFHTQQRREQR